CQHHHRRFYLFFSSLLVQIEDIVLCEGVQKGLQSLDCCFFAKKQTSDEVLIQANQSLRIVSNLVVAGVLSLSGKMDELITEILLFIGSVLSLKSSELIDLTTKNTNMIRLHSPQRKTAFITENSHGLQPPETTNLFNDKNSYRELSEIAEQAKRCADVASCYHTKLHGLIELKERGVDAADSISFMLELSFHVIGEAYNINSLTDFQRSIIRDLVDLGLVKLQQ
ncbi:hypothetical protein S83_043334, partial [Arachis hypogaea]